MTWLRMFAAVFLLGVFYSLLDAWIILFNGAAGSWREALFEPAPHTLWSRLLTCTLLFLGGGLLVVMRQSQQRHRELQSSYQSFFHQSHAVMLLINPVTGAIVDANPQACKFYGYSHQQICGMPLSRINLLAAEEVQQNLLMEHSGEKEQLIIPHRTASGQICMVEVHAAPVIFLGRSVLHVIIHDVTERVESERLLHEREERLNLAVQISNVGIWEWRAQSATLSGDARWAEIMSLSGDRQEILTADLQKIIHPDDFDLVYNALATHARGEAEYFDAEYRLNTGSQNWRWIAVRGKILEHDRKTGAPLSAIGVMRDTSILHQREEALRQTTQNLKERMKELNCLYQSSTLLERNDLTLDEFLQHYVELLPPAWQYPENACARLEYGHKTFQTSNFKQSAWNLSEDILTKKRLSGVLQLCYREERPPADSGPFLHGEQNLLRSLAGRVGRAIDYYESQEKLVQQMREFEVLWRVASGLRSANHKELIFPFILQQAVAAVDGERGAFLLRRGSAAHFVAVQGLAGLDGRVERLEHISFLQPAWEGELHVITDIPSCQAKIGSIHPLLDGITSLVAVPVNALPFMEGLLYVGRSGQTMSAHDLQLLNAIAEIGSSALQRTGLLETLEQRVIDRTQELTALYEIAAIGGNLQDLEQNLRMALEQILRVTLFEMAAVYLLDETASSLVLKAQRNLPPYLPPNLSALSLHGNLWRQVCEKNDPLVLPDLLQAQENFPELAGLNVLEACMMVRMSVSQKQMGLLVIFGPAVRNYRPEDMAFFLSVADHLGLMVQNDLLRKQVRQLAVNEERQRLARELHDAVTQSLSSLSYFTETGLRLSLAGRLERLPDLLARMSETTRTALREMRLLIFELRPFEVENEGLAGALRQRLAAVEQRAGINASLVLEGEQEPVPPEVENALYRIAQEALNNSLKHARANTVVIYLKKQPGFH